MATTSPPAAAAEPNLYSETFANKVGAGNSGTAIDARVNYFPVTLPGIDQLFVYHIKIVSASGGQEVKIAAFKKDLIQKALRLAPLDTRGHVVATDYHSTMVLLKDGPPSIPMTITIPPQGNAAEQKYKISITRTHILYKAEMQNFLLGRGQFDCSGWLVALNILARNMTIPKTVKVGRDRFFPLQPGAANFPLGLNARRGFSASIRPVKGQVVMNMHGVAAAFINEQSLLSYFQTFYRNADLDLRTSDMRSFDSRFKVSGRDQGRIQRSSLLSPHPLSDS